MAEEVSYDDAWWAVHSWFAPNENVGDQQMLGHAHDNINVSTHNGDRNETEDGDVIRKRNGKEIINIDGADANEGKGKEILVDSNDVVTKTSPKGVDVRKPRGKGINVRKRWSNLSAERRRRTKETKLYGELLALLPHLTVKDHKAKIVEEAVSRIKLLEETLRNLEKQKLERLHSASQTLVTNTESPKLLINNDASSNMDTISDEISNSFKTFVSPHVTLNVCGAVAVISICSERIPDLFTTVCYIFEEHNMEVVYTEISSNHSKTMYLIRVSIRGNDPPELVEGFPYEEMYNKAVEQITELVTFQN